MERNNLAIYHVKRFTEAGHRIILDDPEPFRSKLKDFHDEDIPIA
jgi:hypothetical protein